MNKSDVILKVSQQSGVDQSDCEKVLHAFEEVLSDELSNKKGVSSILEVVYKLLSLIKSKKDIKDGQQKTQE